VRALRRVQLVNGLRSAASIVAGALLSPGASVLAVALGRFVGALNRPMQFSAFDTFALAVIRRWLAAAIALFGTVFHLAMRLGMKLGVPGMRLGQVALAWLGFAALPARELLIAFALDAVAGLLVLVGPLRVASRAGASALGMNGEGP